MGNVPSGNAPSGNFPTWAMNPVPMHPVAAIPVTMFLVPLNSNVNKDCQRLLLNKENEIEPKDTLLSN